MYRETEYLIYIFSTYCVHEERVNKMQNKFEPFVCPNPKCAKSFGGPVLLNDFSETPIGEYYACPHCKSKLAPTMGSLKEKQRERDNGETNAPDSTCPHFFGYLKTRPQGDSIPDECLYCIKVLRCLIKRPQTEQEAP